jgi:hypothetical protein
MKHSTKYISLTIPLAIALMPAACSGAASILPAANEHCEEEVSLYVGSLHDDGRSLSVRGYGQDDESSLQSASIASTLCVLDALDAPSSVLSRMETTRALDGTQEATADGMVYRWSYHPNSGMNFIVELQED